MGAESEGADGSQVREETKTEMSGVVGAVGVEGAPVRRLLSGVKGFFPSRCPRANDAVDTVDARLPEKECSSPGRAESEPFRRLLPAALFLITFVSVMAVLLIYMDNTATGRRRFRQIMRQEDELAGVAQDDERLVEFMAQKVLVSAARPFPPHAKRGKDEPTPPREPSTVERFVAQRLNRKKNGVFVELGAYGAAQGEASRTEWLEGELGWRGLLVTPDARDYFRLRARRRAPDTYAAQACVSTSTHPKEITYQESGLREDVGVVGIGALGGAPDEFSARVKCFPLYTFLLAGREPNIDFLSISCGGCELSAFKYLPFDGKVHISIIEIIGAQDEGLEEILASRGYAVSKRTPISTIYTAHDIPVVKI